MKNVFVESDLFELKASKKTAVDCLGDSTQKTWWSWKKAKKASIE